MYGEVNFDGLVGPTHNYAGLAYGNRASEQHHGMVSSPRRAALQGLQKMRAVSQLGLTQGVLPPLRRPRLQLLRDLGFSGSDHSIVDSAWRTDPALVAACFSASSMWTANAATVSPSSDCGDHRLHLTPANLVSGLHRMLEADDVHRLMRHVFPGDAFCVHSPLPRCSAMADEGAANHTRLCADYGQKGIELFVFGKSELDRKRPSPSRYPARQTLEASQAVARRHKLDPARTVFLQQNPVAIDAGVFHNDVIAVGNCDLLLYHEKAFVNESDALAAIGKAAAGAGFEPRFLRVTEQQLSLEDAVGSYLFNSQLLRLDDGTNLLVCPMDVEQNAAAHDVVTQWVDGASPIDAVQYMDLRQSMNNGGGPACLRLRVVMSADELCQVPPTLLMNDRCYEQLTHWVEEHYRDELRPDDLRDPHLIDEIDRAYDALARLVKLPLDTITPR